MNVMGIDPGKNGAFVILKNGHYSFGELFPTDHMKELSFRRLCNRFQALSLNIDLIFIEKVTAMKGWGSKSLFNFGRNYQIALDAASYLSKPIEHVPPKEWQKALFTKEDYIYRWPENKTNKTLDRKQMALVKAKKVFPEQSFIATERSRNPHDGIVDAALIAHYGYLKNKN